MGKITQPKWYDLTVSKDATRKTVVEMGFIKKPEELDQYLEKCLDELCERWAYGNEVGEGGYEHYQVRFVLKKDTWKFLDLSQRLWDMGIRGHLSPTHVRNFDYVTKEGAFVLSWERVLARYVHVSLYLWQILALESYRKQGDRKITAVIDSIGNHGKTFLRKHMVATHSAVYIPPMDCAQDIVACAMAHPWGGYVIDLPRAEGKPAKGMYSAIEQIKDGYLYDKRYNWKEKWIDPPKILVFANSIEEKQLSADRWDILDISDWKVQA